MYNFTSFNFFHFPFSSKNLTLKRDTTTKRKPRRSGLFYSTDTSLDEIYQFFKHNKREMRLLRHVKLFKHECFEMENFSAQGWAEVTTIKGSGFKSWKVLQSVVIPKSRFFSNGWPKNQLAILNEELLKTDVGLLDRFKKSRNARAGCIIVLDSLPTSSKFERLHGPSPNPGFEISSGDSSSRSEVKQKPNCPINFWFEETGRDLELGELWSQSQIEVGGNHLVRGFSCMKKRQFFFASKKDHVF